MEKLQGPQIRSEILVELKPKNCNQSWGWNNIFNSNVSIHWTCLFALTFSFHTSMGYSNFHEWTIIFDFSQIFPDFFSQIFPHSHISSCLPRPSSIYTLNNFEFSTFTWPETSSIHPTWPTHCNHLSCKHSLIVFNFRPFRSSREKILSSDIIISHTPNYPCITSL